MPTPSERLYDAAAAALAGQQATANQIQSGMVPLGAAAAAGSLLLKPAFNDVAHAGCWQIAGIAVGILGLSAIIVAGLWVLMGIEVKGVEPALLTDVKDRLPLSADPEQFDFDAAIALGKVRKEQKPRLDRFRYRFAAVAVGLVLELMGLLVAVAIQPRPKTSPPSTAALEVVHAQLSQAALSLTGQLTSSAHGSVRVVVTLDGRSGLLTSLGPAIHRGRFKVRVMAPRALRPLRSAAYKIIWAGTPAVSAAELVGAMTRCAKDCT
jgi:hypothetical protein